MIETALALSSWGSQSRGETDPFPESGKSEWAAQKLRESRRNFSPSGWFREGFLKEGASELKPEHKQEFSRGREAWGKGVQEESLPGRRNRICKGLEISLFGNSLVVQWLGL